MIEHLKLYGIWYTFLLCANLTFSQQDPQYTLYQYNMGLINPAYATNNPEFMSFGSTFRSQWAGSVGGPTTLSVFGHMQFTDRVEGGISVVHDQIGDVVKETNAYVDVAYVLQLGRWDYLSLGIKAGATFYSTDFNGFVFSDPLPDPAFAENINKTFPNIGIGAFYFGENYYLGLSAPNLLKSKHLERDSGIVALGKEEIHYFFTGGYVFTLSDQFKLKPAFMAKAVAGAPVSFDITANVLFMDMLELGIGYRLDDSISGLCNFRINPSIRIGYSYDYTLSNLGRFNSGTHEVLLLFDLNLFGIKTDKSPRFF